MSVSQQNLNQVMARKDFPRTSRYDAQWVADNQMGPNVLWLTESLCQKMRLRASMRVLDMGCGKAVSSIFLAKEFGVTVWANDLWIAATDNWHRVVQSSAEDRVFPIHAEAHSLPYADEFFDAIVSLDAYHYFGTDDLYLRYFARFLKPGGQLGIVVPGLMQEFDGEVPDHLSRPLSDGSRFWDPTECFSFHTGDWWRRHWQQTGLVDVEVADTLPDGWRLWLVWAEALQALGKGYADEVAALKADEGRYLGFVRLVARKR